MKLCRLRRQSAIIPAALTGEILRDLTSVTSDFDPSFFQERGVEKLAGMDLTILPEVASHDGFAPVVASPSKVVCVGLNYFEHAREAKLGIPDEPVLFFKAPSALSGAYDPIVIPPGATKVDWEVELALIVGRRAKHVTIEEALDHVAGYTILNDVSERGYQIERGGQWCKGKSYDGFAPLGPYLVTGNDVGDSGNLALTLSIGDEVMQNGTSADMIFDLAHVISYISDFMTLMPGDVVTTGTPQGVGLGRDPQRFLKPGEIVRASIEGFGEQVQTVVQG